MRRHLHFPSTEIARRPWSDVGGFPDDELSEGVRQSSAVCFRRRSHRLAAGALGLSARCLGRAPRGFSAAGYRCSGLQKKLLTKARAQTLSAEVPVLTELQPVSSLPRIPPDNQTHFPSCSATPAGAVRNHV